MSSAAYDFGILCSVLGLPPTASREDVKAAFRRLALKVRCACRHRTYCLHRMPV